MSQGRTKDQSFRSRRRQARVLPLLLALPVAGALLAQFGQAAEGGGSPIERVSVSSSGAQNPRWSASPWISPDGRFVAFNSDDHATLAGRVDDVQATYVHDRQTGKTVLGSATDGGVPLQADGGRYAEGMSSDGRFLLFVAAPCVNNCYAHGDIDVRDLQTRKVDLASVAPDGEPMFEIKPVPYAVMSADGRYVAFITRLPGVVSPEFFLQRAIFFRDRQAGTTVALPTPVFPGQLVMTPDARFIAFAAGPNLYLLDRMNGRTEVIAQAERGSIQDFSISADGRYVAYVRYVSNDHVGVVVYDRSTGATTRADRYPDGSVATAVISAQISGNGRYVAFRAYAGNDHSGIYLRDLEQQTTKRADVGLACASPDNSADDPAVSFDGRYVAFTSSGSNLVPNDTNYAEDVFVRDMTRHCVSKAHSAAGTSVTGTTHNDRLVGSAGNDTISGLGGSDKLYGGSGDDVLDGGPGNDLLMGGSGSDRLFGGEGNDFLYGEDGKDDLVGGAGNDHLEAGPGRDRLQGGPGNDALFAADRQADVISCGPGYDYVQSNRGDSVSRDCERIDKP